MQLINEKGVLTDEGATLLEANKRGTRWARLSEDEIRELFDKTRDPKRNQMLEFLVREDVIRTYLVVPRAIEDGDLTAPTRQNPSNGLWSNDGNDVVIITDRQFSTVFDYLESINRIPIESTDFDATNLPDNLAGTVDIRTWTMFRYFAYAIRKRNDPDFLAAYVKAHCKFLAERYLDPLDLITSEDILNAAECDGLRPRRLRVRQPTRNPTKLLTFRSLLVKEGFLDDPTFLLMKNTS